MNPLVQAGARTDNANSKRPLMKSDPSLQSASRPYYSCDFSPPSVGLGLEVSDADEPGGAELCSLAPADWSALPDSGVIASSLGLVALAAPDDGGAELRSAAPPEVSALPDGGWVACFAVSCETPGCVAVMLLSSAAKAGERPSNTATAVLINKRFILLSLSSPCNLANKLLCSSGTTSRTTARKTSQAAMGSTIFYVSGGEIWMPGAEELRSLDVIPNATNVDAEARKRRS